MFYKLIKKQFYYIYNINNIFKFFKFDKSLNERGFKKYN